MTLRAHGFALLEAVLALALGLMLLAAAGQVLMSGQLAWRQQGAAARLQDDAQLALQRLAQDIRMTGTFGCLPDSAIDFHDESARAAFASPLQLTRTRDGHLASLTLVVGDLSGIAGPPEWTLLTDCLTWAQVRPGRHEGQGGVLALPLRRHTYRIQDGSLLLTSGGLNAALIDNVRALQVEVIEADDGMRLDLHLRLSMDGYGIDQTHVLSVALRNRAART